MTWHGYMYVLDGGLATEISRKGIDIDNDPLWSARLLSTDPNLICDVHKSYLVHGADIITTGSYQASVGGFCKYLDVSTEEALELIGQSVKLAVQAREWFLDQPQSKGRMRPLVAGSVGPYGACCHDGSEYNGHYVDVMTTEALADWHRPRIKELLNAGADLLAIETIPALKEAEAVVSLLKEFPSAKGWVAFSCKDSTHTCHGDDFAKSIQAVSVSDQIMAVGVNCTSPRIQPLLASCQGNSNSKPFIVYPNSGEQWRCGEGWYGSKIGYSPNTCIDLGATILGGCCRCTPQDLAVIAEVIDARLCGPHGATPD